MPQFYARKGCRSSQLLLCTLLALQFGTACYGPRRASSSGPAPADNQKIHPEIHPGIHPEIQEINALAQAAERERDYHAARAYYQQAVDQAPDPASAAYATRKMASALAFWGELDGAVRLLHQSLEHNPRQVPVWHDLGVLQTKLGQADAARRALERAVELAPREPRSRIALAALLVRQSEFSLAQSHYQVLLTLNISPQIEKATHEALRLLQREIERQRK